MTQETAKKSPDWKVVTKGRKRLGSTIGVGFNHSTKGITFLLDAAPIPNEDRQIELVVFPFSDDKPTEV